MDGKAPAPNNQGGGGGGGGKKKRNRKKGGAGGGGGATTSNAKGKDAPNGGAPPSTSSAAAGRGGGGSKSGAGSNKNKRRGGGGGGGRGGGGGGSSNSESSRFGKNASSPLQLPHVKVTLRNIGEIHGTSNSNNTANNNSSNNTNKHSTIEGIVDSVKSFLNGAFPTGRWGAEESEAYMMAWQAEKEEFEKAKTMFADAASASSNNNGGGTDNSTRPFSSGWVYEPKPQSLPTNRSSLLPSSTSIASQLLQNQTEKKIHSTSNINWVVDTAMSQMFMECGKEYLNYVGGRVLVEEESCVEVGLAERVMEERRRLEEEKKEEERMEKERMAAAEEAEVEGEGEKVDGVEQSNGADATSGEKKEEEASVEAVTKGIQNLSTSPKNNPATTATTKLPQQTSSSTIQPATTTTTTPAIRIRILSVTPVKTSKRRGQIGGKVTLALYPPDPCLLFKEEVREAGKLAGELHLENVKRVEEERKEAERKAKEEAERKAKEDAEKKAKEEAEKEAKKVAPVEQPAEGESGETNDGNEGGEASSESKEDDKEDDKKADEPSTDAKKVVNNNNSSKPQPPPPVRRNIPDRVPQIPYYPLLSPAERSRAVARSRVLLHRTIEALKLYAAGATSSSAAASAGGQSSSRSVYSTWEIMESSSQKTWKSKPHPMVASLMAGAGGEGGPSLSDLVVEYDNNAKASSSTGGSGAASKKGRGGGRGYDSRADRYDSTIENSEDFKLFMQSFQSGDAIPSVKEESSTKDGNKKGNAAKSTTNEANEKPTPVDEEGRPLSAIVMYMREKQAEVDRAKAEAAAAAAKARAAAAAAKEKARKEKLKAKKEASRKKKKQEVGRGSKKQQSSSGGRDRTTSSSSSRPGSSGGGRKGSSKSSGSSSSAAMMPPPGAMLLKKGGVSSAIPPSGFGA